MMMGGMTVDEKFIFDLSGFIVLEGMLQPEQVGVLNAILDAHAHEATRSPSYGGDWPGMQGEGNPMRRICTRLLALARATADGGSCELTHQEVAAAVRQAGFPPPANSQRNGYKIRDHGVASTDSLRSALGALAGPSGLPLPLEPGIIDDLVVLALGDGNDSDEITLGSSRYDLGGMLSWAQPEARPFRDLLVHPRLKGVLEEILGKGYRMDHMPDLMRMENGGDGQTLHGGAFERYDKGGMLEGYQFHGGKMFAGMVVVEWMLADEGPGDGGVAVVQGSHKSNFPAPTSLKMMDRYQSHVTEVHAKAGDVIIFCEACIHGSLPWRGAHERRALLYRFNPGYAAYSPGLADLSYPSWMNELTPEQQAVLMNPAWPASMRPERVADYIAANKARL
jgi:hypothetical protein